MNEPHLLLSALRTLDDRKNLPRDRVEQAASALQGELGKLASRHHRTGAGTLVIPRQEQEDIVQKVLLKLLTTSILSAILDRTPSLVEDPAALERSCWAYLSAMIRNAFLSSIDGNVKPSAAPSPGNPPQDLAPAKDSGDTAVLTLQKAADFLVKNPGKRDASKLRTQLEQLSGLCTGALDMGTLLAMNGAGPGVPADEVERVRDRLSKQHERLRAGLLAAIDRMQTQQLLTVTEAEVGRLSLRTLLMRVQRTGAPVRPDASSRSSKKDEP